LTGVPVARTVRVLGRRPSEVAMTRHLPARFALAALFAVLLTACAGGDTGVDEAGNAAAATSAAQEDVDSGEPGDSDEGSDDSGSSDSEDDGGDAAGRPGAPAPEEPDGARPGGPFDVEAFEQIGQPAEDFLPFGRDYCSDGRCTLVEETVEDPTVGYCGVSSFSYNPPARPEGAPASDQFIQRGTTVTVVITCPPEESTTEEESTDEAPAEESAEETPTEEEPTPEATEESTEEEPAA
jgi:hypothetical protein